MINLESKKIKLTNPKVYKEETHPRSNTVQEVYER
jgi:hypothetical protein